MLGASKLNAKEHSVIKVLQAASAIVLAASIASPAMAVMPGKVLQTAVVDGFTVNVLRFPTVARLAKPTTTTGTVTIGAGADGTSPYSGTALAGSAFLSMNGGSATYVLKHPASWVAFIWGTPDSYNTVSLYDTTGALIGTLNGGDIASQFGFTDGQYMQILSPTPVGSVVANSTQCCFEVGNQTSKPVPRQ